MGRLTGSPICKQHPYASSTNLSDLFGCCRKTIPEHQNHGAAAEAGCGRNALPLHPTKQTKDRCLSLLRLHTPFDEVLRRNKEQLVQQYRVEHPQCSEADAIDQLSGTRDWHLNTTYLYNQRCQIEKQEWRYHPDSLVSVYCASRLKPDCFLMCQLPRVQQGPALAASVAASQPSSNANVSVIIGIQHPWQLDQLIEYGHANRIQMDSTFATNNLRVRLLH